MWHSTRTSASTAFSRSLAIRVPSGSTASDLAPAVANAMALHCGDTPSSRARLPSLTSPHRCSSSSPGRSFPNTTRAWPSALTGIQCGPGVVPTHGYSRISGLRRRPIVTGYPCGHELLRRRLARWSGAARRRRPPAGAPDAHQPGPGRTNRARAGVRCAPRADPRREERRHADQDALSDLRGERSQAHHVRVRVAVAGARSVRLDRQGDAATRIDGPTSSPRTWWRRASSVAGTTCSACCPSAAIPDLAIGHDQAVTTSASTSPSTVLVTGCSSGFGLLTAVTFARRGHHVVASMRNTAKAEPLLEAAAAAGVGVEVAELDVTSSASVDRAIDAIVESTGRLDVVVNNAGIELFGAVHLVSDEEADPPARHQRARHRARRPSRGPAHGAPGPGVDRQRRVGGRQGRCAVLRAVRGEQARRRGDHRSDALRARPARHPGGGRRTGAVRDRVVRKLRRRRVDAGGFGRVRPLAGVPGPDAPARRRRAGRSAAGGRRRSTRPRRRTSRGCGGRCGDDASLVLDTKAAMSFEDFESAMRATLDWHE